MSVYPETIVLFADIQGFITWSCISTPVEVFILLETLYGYFDKCARARCVFKVETICSSYVVVVGRICRYFGHFIYAFLRYHWFLLTPPLFVATNHIPIVYFYFVLLTSTLL
jgi:Adenylate and Guanylate cyclase catalytic domain